MLLQQRQRVVVRAEGAAKEARGEVMSYTKAEAVQAFNSWWKRWGHWIYTRAAAADAWHRIGIEGLPPCPLTKGESVALGAGRPFGKHWREDYVANARAPQMQMQMEFAKDAETTLTHTLQRTGVTLIVQRKGTVQDQDRGVASYAVQCRSTSKGRAAAGYIEELLADRGVQITGDSKDWWAWWSESPRGPIITALYAAIGKPGATP